MKLSHSFYIVPDESKAGIEQQGSMIPVIAEHHTQSMLVQNPLLVDSAGREFKIKDKEIDPQWDQGSKYDYFGDGQNGKSYSTAPQADTNPPPQPAPEKSPNFHEEEVLESESWSRNVGSKQKAPASSEKQSQLSPQDPQIGLDQRMNSLLNQNASNTNNPFEVDEDTLLEQSENLTVLFKRPANEATTSMALNKTNQQNQPGQQINRAKTFGPQLSLKDSEVISKESLARHPVPADSITTEVLNKVPQSNRYGGLPQSQEETQFKRRACRLLQIDTIDNLLVLTQSLLNDQKQQIKTRDWTKKLEDMLAAVTGILHQALESLSRGIKDDSDQLKKINTAKTANEELESDREEYNRLLESFKRKRTNISGMIQKNGKAQANQMPISDQLFELSKVDMSGNKDIQKLFKFLCCFWRLSQETHQFNSEGLVEQMTILEKAEEMQVDQFLDKFQIAKK